jgi:hypothetical protein
MYSLINENCHFIHNHKNQKGLLKHFSEYVFLLDRNNWNDEIKYKSTFKSFWGMNAARGLSANKDFEDLYFSYLKFPPLKLSIYDLLEKIKNLDETTEKKVGFQFSFATKAIHILNPDLPIYDVNVRRFYFLNDIEGKYWEAKQEIASRYYIFLQKEYRRIIDEELLAPTIREIDTFLEKNNIDSQNSINQIKKIDSIIWAWVNYLKKRDLSTSQVIWQ